MVNRRLIVIVIVIIGLVLSFWSTSRYPALGNKAGATGLVVIQDTLTHQAHFQISANDSFIKKVWFTTLNWSITNQQGMTFAVLLAAAF